MTADFAPAPAYGSGHRGIDLPADPGTSIRAVADSAVALAGKVAGKPVVVLLVDTPDLGRVRVTYEPVLPLVQAGARVLAGQVIGVLAGAGGHCGRVPHCLHLGIKQDGRYLDPAPFLPTGRVVLKPVRTGGNVRD
jgi:murein DD-endopeptidase MepM/ murein hydrolase activator NlpD